MFSKVIVKSVPLASGLYRYYGKNIYKLQMNLQTDLKIISCNKRYVNTSCALQSSKPSTKEKELKEKDVKRRSELRKEYETKEMVEKLKRDIEAEFEQEVKRSKRIEKIEKIEVKEDLPVETEYESEQQKEKKREKQWRSRGRQMILNSFEQTTNKNKDTFLECLRMYTNTPGKKTDRVLFIYVALKHMEDFDVHKDLQVYKALLDIFPKETMVPTNVFQNWFVHYPKEQFCAVRLFEQMEDNSVMPDPEMELMVLNIFGSEGLPTQKYWKMMYWMPKFKHLNPWPVPNPIPNEPFELAKLAMIKISSIDVESKLSIFDTDEVEDAIDKTWIVSAMAPKQSELLRKHDKKTPIYVEGPHKIYVATKCVDYFVLKADPAPDRQFPDIDTDAVDQIRNPYLDWQTTKSLIIAPSVHEEVDGTIFAVCATGTSTKDTLLSWIRCLQKTNPVLGELPVVFKLKNIVKEGYYIEDGSQSTGEQKSDSDKEQTQ